jgi:hypothetical protein
MSGPMVTGVVSLILEANPQLSSEQVKEIIKLTARTDNNTGVIPVEGSLRWGWGKLNAYAAVQLAIQTEGVGINETEKSFDLVLFPNPANDKVYISHSSNESIQLIELVTIDGKISQLTTDSEESIDVSGLESGMYFLRLTLEGKTKQITFIKQ